MDILDQIIKVANKGIKFEKRAKITKEDTILERFFSNAGTLSEEAHKQLSLYVGFLRALYLIHQQNHWETKMYQQHLLFQRLYENVFESVDDAGEKVVGLFGKILSKNIEFEIVKQFKVENPDVKSCVECSLRAEKGYQNLARKIYDGLKERNELTLGLDDMLMSQANDGETRIYLLQQSIE
jgi:DNA-binding ferritin-like protein